MPCFALLAEPIPKSRRIGHREKLRRLCYPACKALPFVKLKENAEPTWVPESYWHTEPSGNWSADMRRGRQYAKWRAKTSS
jgi:hypothetical protein